MLKTITQESAERICCLIIGKPGIGKTSLIWTISGHAFIDGAWQQIIDPDTIDKVVVISAESGLLAVRDLVKAGRVEGYEISSLEEFKQAYQLLASTPEMKERYSWIFIDSLTEIASRCEEAMKEKYPNASDTYKMWGDYSSIMTTLIKAFRDLTEYNVVFTSLETVEKDENNKRYIAPMMSGKGLKEKLPSFFDEVFYLTIEQDSDGRDHRIFYTQPVKEYPAKDRSGKLNPIEIPNLLTIKNKILNGGK
ncbi:MAG: ATP-binding protein [Proteobacteria bacterium]|nr:ATP-binding protein [Pseudomonadota bacterium]